MTPKWDAKTDANQKAIVGILRVVGFKVLLLHRLGQGYPDILVSGVRLGETEPRLLLVEIKTKGGRLTKDEREFHDEWADTPLIIAREHEDVLRWYERTDLIPRLLTAADRERKDGDGNPCEKIG